MLGAVLEVCERVLRENHHLTIRVRANLAQALDQRGQELKAQGKPREAATRFDEAERICRSVLVSQEEECGSNALATINA